MQVFLVGGAVRDMIMGKTPKDLDYTVVLDPGSYADPYAWMVEELESEGFKIFRKPDGTPVGAEHLTARARFPKGHVNERMGGDFVLARRESGYSDGRHPDSVTPGTLLDDLERRDFTMNAIAQDLNTGEFIDPFNGREDIGKGIIRAVGDPFDRLEEDALRALRALRFSVQLGFKIERRLAAVMESLEVHDAIINNVSDERKMDELNKMFKVDTLESMFMLERFYVLRNAVFGGKVNLEATMKQKGFSDKKATREQGKSKLAPAYGGCQCHCHTEKGVMHMSACCRPNQEENK